MAVYVVVKLTVDEWQRIYRGGSVLISDLEAILSPEELRKLNLWDAAREVQSDA